MKKIILLVISLLLSFIAFAQNVDSVIVITPEKEPLDIGRQVYILEDKEGKLGIGDILQPKYQQLFKKSTSERPNFNVTHSKIWVKFTVSNQTDEKVYLELANALGWYIDFYKPNASGKPILATQTGMMRPMKNREVDNNFFLFGLSNSPKVQTYYLSIVSDAPLTLPLTLGTGKSLYEKNSPYLLFMGMFSGLMIIMFFYNLFVYSSVREKIYLYYCGYLLMSLFNFNFISGNYGYRWNIISYFSDYLLIFMNLGGICIASFLINLLQAKRHHLFFKITVLFLLLNYVLLGINIYTARYVLVIDAMQVLMLIFYPYVFGHSLIRYRKGNSSARFIVFGFSFYLVGVMVFIFQNFALLPTNFLTMNAIILGTSMEVLLFSLALGDRINVMRKEKAESQTALLAQTQENEKLIKEQNTILEQKVKERTLQLEETNEELNQTNEELQSTLELVETERAKSDQLLLNILPTDVANELKETGKTEVRYFGAITVLFADVKGFSALATKISPHELIAELDATFSKMDEISMRFGLERIKTIGDCYMACGGLPEPNHTHPFDVVLTALHIQHWMSEEKKRRNGNFWQARVGLHTGEAVAGVIGKTKFAYDVWGNTVNLASRMESGGEVGKVNVTQQTFEAVQDYFEGNYREEIEAKNIGKVRAYFIDRLKPEYSQDELGFEPNEKFWEVYRCL